MLRVGQVDISIDIDSIPILKGAIESMQLGIFSSLQPSNVRLRRAIKNQEAAVEHTFYPLLFDPQTAGGLLASVPGQFKDSCVSELQDLGYENASIIGTVQKQGDSLESIFINL